MYSKSNKLTFLPPCKTFTLPISSPPQDANSFSRTPFVMLRVQKSRRPSISHSVQSSLVGRFLPTELDGSETLVDVLQPQDPQGPPSTAEYGLENGSGMRMYRLRRERWNGRSAAAKRLWMNETWRHAVLEKRRKTRGTKDQDAVKGDRKGPRQVKRCTTYWSEAIGAEFRETSKSLLRKEVQLKCLDFALKRNDAAYKKERMAVRSKQAVQRHKRMRNTRGTSDGDGD